MLDPFEIFHQSLKKTTLIMDEKRQDGDPDCSAGGMIQACLEGDKTNTSETRYLLLLTENYGDLAILQQKISSMHNAVVIFGSSFPSDQEYTQVCRNINRIKVNMETGSTVILLNLENLYESLYDALNQYYVRYGGENYVDLGLGSHRVKCKVHKDFRKRHKVRGKGDVFLGFHADTCAAIIMQLFEDKKCPYDEVEQSVYNEITTHSKLLSTPDLEDLSAALHIQRQNMTLLTLQSFDTEQQFCRQIRFILEKSAGGDNLLIVQCDCGDQNSDLIACARYIHIDELRPPPKKMPSLIEMYLKPVSAFLEVRRSKAEMKPGEDAKHVLETDIDIDSESEIDESIDILSLILNCTRDLFNGIAVHLKSLLKEKEVDESELHREWLSTEASNPDHINSAGTFRGAALKCLEEKVTSLLAGVIAFIDKNRNLNIIACDQVEHWMIIFWLEILNSPRVTGLHYNIDFFAQSYQTSTEYMVQSTAYEGGAFQAKLPFSWIIFSLIDKILKYTSEEQQPQGQVAPSSYDLVMLAASIFESTPLGQLLSHIERTHVQVIRCYVIDFVHMAHPGKSESEHRIICENIITGCKQIIKGKIGCLFPALIGCHKGFEIFGPRFRNFQIFFMYGLNVVKVLKFEEESDKEMMYLLTDDEIMLKGEIDMKKMQSVEKVEKFIKSCNKDVSSKIFGIKDTLPSPPVTLPCHHTICRRCFDETIAAANVKCPKCDQKFEKDIEPVPGDQTETVHAYQDFRRRCNSFFMEVVSQLCFAESTPPCDEVVDKLLSYITIQTRNGQQVTKELTIFDDCIDPTPVVRSFLLQHLMRTSRTYGTEVNRHLEQYFRRALRVFDPSKEAHTKPHDMCLLVIQCMEDSCHQQYSEENPEQILAAMEMLRNASTKIKLDTDKLIENMEHLSRTRFSLSIAAKFMYKVFVEKAVAFDKRLKRLFESVKKSVRNVDLIGPNAFVKTICRCYGIDSYQTIRRDCDLTVKSWINLPELKKDKIEECCDRFIVFGIKYSQMRETFVRAALNTDAHQLENLLQCKRDHWITEISFLLVVYREITMNCLYEEEQQQFSKVKNFLHKTLMNSKAVKDKDCYFPTMPQDDLDEVKEAVLAARDEDSLENPVFYNNFEMASLDLDYLNCPFFKYICILVFFSLKCGRPTFADKCRECGQEIGGESYELKEGNIKDAGSIKPDIESEEVPAYITEHMLEDLRSISYVLGKSKDVVLLMHYLLSEIMNNQTAARVGERVEDDICFLRNKRSRAIWEEKINRRYVVPVLEKSEEILREVTCQMVADKRLGADPLLQLLYETNNTAEVMEDNNLCEKPSVWQFRDRISVNHLIQMFTRSRQNCPVMKHFLEEDHFLRAIRFVPSIIKLQRILIQKYNPRRQDLENCWTDFKQVWESLRLYLDGYGFPLNGSFVYLSKEYCQKRMDDKTSVSYILPANKGHGLCSYVLLFFLLEKQNLFLQKYCIEGRIKYDSLPRVKVKDLSTAHLISYHPDRDLLPMVLANCNYSFEVGQGTKVEYNFVSLERQLMDRLLFTKSVILLKEIDTVVYRSETTNAIVFNTLRDKIRQERISPAVVGQIEEELRSKTFPDLCGSMDTLDIAISFLKSVGADPESLLNDFIVNILKIDHFFVSQKAQMSCKCKHVQSLWITLALEKTKRLEKHYEESFDGVSSAFKEKLSEEQIRVLNHIFGNLQIEQLAFMSEIIFECIMLNIDIPKKDEESVDMSREGFKEALSTYLFDPPYLNEALTPDWLQQVVDALLLEEKTRILCSHVVETWVFINDLFTEKKDEL
ncbi:RNF213 [Mytilus edulis]|uniref:RNF213 n=1 Tax=Mytilus edulis TaxID=6550 RepID=A0A8S3T914_MYTED|nr:RNF213 [Mytilus edulis]